MNNTIAAGLVGVSALLAVGAVDASPNGGFFARGRVLSAEPVFQTVSVNHPQQRCWDERVEEHHGGHYYRAPPPGAGLAGAVIGGVIGNQLGRGHEDRALATATGAVVGGAISRGASSRTHYEPETVTSHTERRCDVVDHYQNHREVVGYRVRYEYDGKTFWTETRDDPGKWVQVHVSVNAVDDGR